MIKQFSLQTAIQSAALALPLLLGTSFAYANETVVEKAHSGLEEGVKDVKQEYRNQQDKACNPKDGDKNCTLKTIKHKAQNARDEVEQEAAETKRKVD